MFSKHRKAFLEFVTWLLILSTSIIESATDEKLPHYRALVTDDQLANRDKRFQQIMQGGGGSHHDPDHWPQPKLKSDKVDVKTEIAKLNTTYVYQSSWPETKVKLGQVTAVSFDKDGNVVVFHRCDRVWEMDTFDYGNMFTKEHLGPIRESTVLALEPNTGKLVYDWGKNLFYMPHGLTVDHEDNVWITDVALHQVFKFGPRGSKDKPLMSLGTPFVPGAGDTKFCKPTSVAVLENGDFFVADGYCNARILKYSKNGEKILSWGQNSFAGVSHDIAPRNYLAVPHALTLIPEQELICVADRENGRVQCFFWGNGKFHSQYYNQIIGDRLFSVAYTPAQGGQFVIVNGPSDGPGHYNEVHGYVLDVKSKQVLSKFGPNNLQFANPHDVAVTADGTEIYVAELNPMRIHKFLHKNVTKSTSITAVKPSVAETGVGPEYVVASFVKSSAINGTTADSTADTAAKTHSRPSGTAILVASLMLLFAFFTFAMALLIARRRKRGCLPFGAQNRRHAWDFPAKQEGFKLGGLLMDRSKRSGFEKLDQNASDEEHEVTTNMLDNAPFA